MSRRPTDPWSLLEAGRYDDAHAAFGAELDAKATPAVNRAFLLRGRAICSLARGRPAEALPDLEQEMALRAAEGARGEAALLGAVLWMLGRRPAAVEAWRSGLTAVYVDAAGGFASRALLLYAGVRLRDEALVEEAEAALAELVARPAGPTGVDQWPGPLAMLLLGRLAWRDAIACASLVDGRCEREECQAHFWRAVERLRAGDEAGWRAALEAATSRESKRFRAAYLETEYWLARHELA